ncbi:MAG: macrolide family glycosyltransferase [Lachnospiraceae bacterium]
MSKIVFFCIPAQGHTNPTLGVVQTLIKEGHEVYYYSYEMMREKIEATGATFVACDQYDSQVHLSKEDGARLGKDLAFSTDLIVDLTLELDDAIVQDMKKLNPDVVVADSMAFWGKLIAKKLGIPFVSSTTTFAFNQYSAKVMKSEGPGFFSILRSMPKINKSLKRLRSKGYEVKSVLDIIANDNNTKTIVYTSPMFQPYSETFSESYVFVGPIPRKVTESLEKTDQKTVYISLGTVDNNHPDFYEKCFAAVKDQPYRVVMSVGEDTDITGLEIPSNCIVEKMVDQMAVLEQADVFITHCGMNSVSEGLYYGVPLILFPQTPEQQGVANRVQELKAGVFLSDISVEGIRNRIDEAIHDKEIKENALKIQQSFKECGGAKAAADFILKQVEH